MRKIIPLDKEWWFAEGFEEKYINESFDDSQFQLINIPHTNKEVPYNYFDERIYQFVSCYRKSFTIGKECEKKRVFIDFEGVMCYAKVYLNGIWIGEHKGGYTPFSFDITDFVYIQRPNTLVVMVDSTERSDIPPFGYVIDFLTYGGVYREVSLRIVDRVFINNVRLEAINVLESNKKLKAEIFFKNNTDIDHNATITVLIKNNNSIVEEFIENIIISKEISSTEQLLLNINHDIKLWDIETPELYDIEIHLHCGNYLDVYIQKFGFRDAVFKKDGFYLNGKSIKIRGLNRHQAYPYVGYAMPKRVQRKDADILKYELGLNMVRTSHYPQSIHFLNRCDEVGLLVLEEIPGWQHIGDEKWKEVAKQNEIEMIKRDWNHPSIVLWGVRINESLDDYDFYSDTNNIARNLDPSRQTCGIRCHTDSEFLEDVYTMNDFIHSGGKDVLREQKEVTGLSEEVPYLVTEYGGHMYPTKRIDCEERQMEHCLRHLRILNAAAMDAFIGGTIGWCAFDYNTHKDFGSGDRICYHGIMDMFRIPKFAAFAYKSQMEPVKQVVLEPVTFYTRGERAIGGIVPLVILTNCDYIDFIYGGENLGRYYPAYKDYPGLTHPPVIIEKMPGEWGMEWKDGEFAGYIGAKEVIRKKFCANPIPTRLIAIADDNVIFADGIDATRVVYKLVDQENNLLPYSNETIKISVEGPGELIGPNEMPLIGGCIAVWVKSKNQKGELSITAHCSRFESNKIIIRVE